MLKDDPLQETFTLGPPKKAAAGRVMPSGGQSPSCFSDVIIWSGEVGEKRRGGEGHGQVLGGGGGVAGTKRSGRLRNWQAFLLETMSI